MLVAWANCHSGDRYDINVSSTNPLVNHHIIGYSLLRSLCISFPTWVISATSTPARVSLLSRVAAVIYILADTMSGREGIYIYLPWVASRDAIPRSMSWHSLLDGPRRA